MDLHTPSYCATKKDLTFRGYGSVVTSLRARNQVDVCWNDEVSGSLSTPSEGCGLELHRTYALAPDASPQEPRFYILPISLVGSLLVEHFLLVKDLLVTISSVNEYASHTSPSLFPALLYLHIAGTFFFLNPGGNASPVFVFVFNRCCSKADSSFSCIPHFIVEWDILEVA